MEIFQSKYETLSGSSFGDVHAEARAIFLKYKKRTKRKPYLRSAYFSKDKVFLDLFWTHIWQKNWKDRTRRLILYPCALDLVERSRIPPLTKENPNNKHELLHRFAGRSKDKVQFYVQMKEDKREKQKHLISVFPL